MTAPDIAQICRHGIRSTLELWLLLLAGQAGTPGITIVSAAAIVGESRAAVRAAFGRLVKRELVMAPSRDTSLGRTNRYTILPAGLALLLTRAADSPIPFDTMTPLPVAV